MPLRCEICGTEIREGIFKHTLPSGRISVKEHNIGFARHDKDGKLILRCFDCHHSQRRGKRSSYMLLDGEGKVKK